MDMDCWNSVLFWIPTSTMNSFITSQNIFIMQDEHFLEAVDDGTQNAAGWVGVMMMDPIFSPCPARFFHCYSIPTIFKSNSMHSDPRMFHKCTFLSKKKNTCFSGRPGAIIFRKLKCHLRLANKWCFMKPGNTPTHEQVGFENRPRYLATAMRVTIDTTVPRCEVTKVHSPGLAIELNRQSHHWWRHLFVRSFRRWHAGIDST